MKKIGLLSDTHGNIYPGIFKFFDKCDEIWHAGDFGNTETALALSSFRFLRGVYGNIDGHELRLEFPMHQRFMCEEIDVWMTHIGGYPGHYDRRVKPEISVNPPDLFITGHSHILKVIYDKKNGFLHINPGAAGNKGFHKVITAIRFNVEQKRISDLEILEADREKYLLSV
jgi:uncharacterized protein